MKNLLVFVLFGLWFLPVKLRANDINDGPSYTLPKYYSCTNPSKEEKEVEKTYRQIICQCLTPAWEKFNIGTPDSIASGSISYLNCLERKIDILTDDFFSTQKEKEAFLQKVHDIRSRYFKINDAIFMENKACINLCGQLDGVLPFAPTMSLLEGIIQDLISTRINKNMKIPSQLATGSK
ncbi:MAG: hypothetical protein AB7G80_04945 [Dongiaceae bacterium]